MYRILKKVGIKYKSVRINGNGRRPDDLVRKQSDRETFSKLYCKITFFTSFEKEVFFLDECVFSSKTYQKRAWSTMKN